MIKFIKAYKKYMNRKGMTLVELIVAIALTGMIVASCAILTNVFTNSYIAGSIQADALLLLDELEDGIDDAFSGATGCWVSTSNYVTPSVSGYHYSYIANNKVNLYSTVVGNVGLQDVISAAAYNGYTATWYVNVDNNSTDGASYFRYLHIYLYASKSGSRYFREFYVAMPNLSGQIQYLGTGTVVRLANPTAAMIDAGNRGYGTVRIEPAI